MPSLRSWSRRTNRVSLLLAICGLFCFSQVCAAVERETIHFFRYANTSSKEKLEAFNGFAEILTQKLHNLKEEVGSDGAILPLDNLVLQKVVRQDTREHLEFTGMSPYDLQSYWERHGALAVLFGRLREDNRQFAVRSKFFFGPPQLAPLLSTVTVDLPLRDDQFDTTRDSHSAMTLFAIAVNSIDRCDQRDRVMILFDEAFKRASAAKEAFTDFDGVRAAIARAVEELKSACP